jgi:hypothetical protein
VKRKELIRQLEADGCVLVRHVESMIGITIPSPKYLSPFHDMLR